MSPILNDEPKSYAPNSNTSELGVGANGKLYDVFQQVFGLSMASNALHKYKGKQQDLQAALQTALPGILARIGDGWDVVWGPVVWKKDDDPSTGPDNSWFVAHSPGLTFDDGSVHEAYVVAIAGTATSYDWFVEDLGVSTVVDFLAWAASGITQLPVPVSSITPNVAYAAYGTTAAVHNLLTVPSPTGAAAAGDTLYEFLSRTHVSSSTRFVFTGHSLGGALASTMALALAKSGALKEEVLVYPTAGPSPGNGSFADIFAQTFPASPTTSSDVAYAVWNANIINSIDVVPQAWCTDSEQSPAQNMDNIPTIYGTPAILAVLWVLGGLKEKAKESRTVYIPLQSREIPGTKPTSTPTTYKEFVRVALENHIEFYLNVFGMSPPKFVIRASDELVEKEDNEKILGYPIIGNIEWANEHSSEVEIGGVTLQTEEDEDEDAE